MRLRAPHEHQDGQPRLSRNGRLCLGRMSGAFGAELRPLLLRLHRGKHCLVGNRPPRRPLLRLGRAGWPQPRSRGPLSSFYALKDHWKFLKYKDIFDELNENRKFEIAINRLNLKEYETLP